MVTIALARVTNPTMMIKISANFLSPESNPIDKHRLATLRENPYHLSVQNLGPHQEMQKRRTYKNSKDALPNFPDRNEKCPMIEAGVLVSAANSISPKKLKPNQSQNPHHQLNRT